MEDDDTVRLLETIVQNAKVLSRSADPVVGPKAKQILVTASAILTVVNPTVLREKLVEYE